MGIAATPQFPRSVSKMIIIDKNVKLSPHFGRKNRYKDFKKYIKKYGFTLHHVPWHTGILDYHVRPDIMSVRYSERGMHLFTCPVVIYDREYDDHKDINLNCKYPSYDTLKKQADGWNNKIKSGWLNEYNELEREERWDTGSMD